MEEYKVLVRFIVPEIERQYEAYIPINKTIFEVSKLVNQAVNDLSEIYPICEGVRLYNRRTGALYTNNLLVRDTDIQNGTELVMISSQV